MRESRYGKNSRNNHNQKRGGYDQVLQEKRVKKINSIINRHKKKVEYQKDRTEFVIEKRDWIKLSLIRQGNLCKRYSVIFTKKKKPGAVDRVLIKMDIRNFNLTNMNKGIDLINKRTEKLGRGIDVTFKIIDKTLDAVGKVGIQSGSERDPFTNLFGKNKFDVKF